jgi:peptide-methionine (R)-S-oxide reductase
MSMRFVVLSSIALLVGCDVGEHARPGPTSLTAVQTAPETSMNNRDTVVSVTHTEAEWKNLLTPEQFAVLRQRGTERAFTGEYTDNTEAGTYYCAACGAELFSSQHKFHSGCGWPSFYTTLAGDRVKLQRDASHGMVRTEVTCARCGSHLGHVFDDAPDQPTGQRYCINSVALKFVPQSSTSRPASR